MHLSHKSKADREHFLIDFLSVCRSNSNESKIINGRECILAKSLKQNRQRISILLHWLIVLVSFMYLICAIFCFFCFVLVLTICAASKRHTLLREWSDTTHLVQHHTLFYSIWHDMIHFQLIVHYNKEKMSIAFNTIEKKGVITASN